ncbi:hypothetical protein SXCC_03135 [Gluconacetobacter sp. SXCC-1]|nr:hypothetical protein SXCC_03135 [Gluconacetobacter sp. SXCC-1]
MPILVLEEMKPKAGLPPATTCAGQAVRPALQYGTKQDHLQWSHPAPHRE